MINVKKLKIKMFENDMNVEQLAESLDIHKATMYRKLSNEGETLTIKEASAIVKILKLTQEEVIEIFFANVVA